MAKSRISSSFRIPLEDSLNVGGSVTEAQFPFLILALVDELLLGNAVSV